MSIVDGSTCVSALIRRVASSIALNARLGLNRALHIFVAMTTNLKCVAIRLGSDGDASTLDRSRAISGGNNAAELSCRSMSCDSVSVRFPLLVGGMSGNSGPGSVGVGGNDDDVGCCRRVCCCGSRRGIVLTVICAIVVAVAVYFAYAGSNTKASAGSYDPPFGSLVSYASAIQSDYNDAVKASARDVRGAKTKMVSRQLVDVTHTGVVSAENFYYCKGRALPSCEVITPGIFGDFIRKAAGMPDVPSMYVVPGSYALLAIPLPRGGPGALSVVVMSIPEDGVGMMYVRDVTDNTIRVRARIAGSGMDEHVFVCITDESGALHCDQYGLDEGVWWKRQSVQ